MAIDLASLSFHRAGRQGGCTTAGDSVCMRRAAQLRKNKAFRIVDAALGPLTDKQQGGNAHGEEQAGKRNAGSMGMAGLRRP